MKYIQFDDQGNILGMVTQDTPPAFANFIVVDAMPAADQMVDIATKTLKARPSAGNPPPVPPPPPPG